ncbi:DUF2182 domain-containing protein [Roseibium suaedae]|uniref:Predicted metal-binding membrane protein n=1 Tax=Roseibium suaedae TaxID=735517 RepID=A0A1M7PNU2_9HYPH|nr:DUF2182 domain-containing protein [Roseibium suaedae]SHN18889.1 Predicted metal-binding membrane protein [Roseibium suaedae]
MVLPPLRLRVAADQQSMLKDMNVAEVQPKQTLADALETSPRGWPLVLVCLGGLTVTGWLYLGAMIADMVPAMDMSEAGPGMGLLNYFNNLAGLPDEVRAAIAALCLPESASTFGMPSARWTLADGLKVFTMWFMMALAMMIPTAIPMLRAFMREQAPLVGSGHLTGQTLLAAGGYLFVWTGYAVAATLVQWLLTLLGALGPMMAPVSLALSASVLVAAGIYQFTPAKQSCLVRCWHPRFAFSRNGAFREGITQGLSCLGCCWAVMAVMFAVGVMNVLWVALLGVLMAVEKSLPSRWIYRIAGAVFLVWGTGLGALILMAQG